MQLIDEIKENEILPTGSTLKHLKKRTSNSLKREKALRLEQVKSFASLQDPLSAFLDYIEWTKKAYPLGDSSIGTCGEQAVRQFRKDTRYANDIRYVQLWMEVAKQQQDPAEVFKYLVANEIGQQSALFYVEYARFKESHQQMKESKEIYELGMNRKAEPKFSLESHYENFCDRMMSEESAEDLIDAAVANVSQDQSQICIPSRLSKSLQSSKFHQQQSMPLEFGERVSKQDAHPLSVIDVAKTTNAQSKLNIFRNEEVEEAESKAMRMKKKSKTVVESTLKSKKDDISNYESPITEGSRLIANVDLCYVNNIEFSFEENRAALCNQYSVELQTPRKSTFINPAVLVASPWHPPQNFENSIATSPGENGMENVYKMFDPEPLKSSSPTIHTKLALSEVADFFVDAAYNQPSVVEQNESEILYYPEDDETISRKVYKRPTPASFKIGVFRDDEEEEDFRKPTESTPLNRPMTNVFGHSVHVMTPLTEYSDRTHQSTYNYSFSVASDMHQAPIFEESEITDDTMTHLLQLIPKVVQGVASPCNPSDSCIRQAVLTLVKPPPESKLYLQPLKISTLGQRLDLAEPNTDLKISDEDYVSFIDRLNSAYLIQRPNSSQQTVFKIQSPPSVWEYYILFLLHSKLPTRMSRSIVHPSCCYLFQNESILEEEYVNGGSLQEFIDKAHHRQGNLMLLKPEISEVTAAFFTYQILSIVHAVHSAGVIHGDVRIGNFLLRKPDSVSTQDFDATGVKGWSQFSLCLTDWAASIDLNAFPTSQTFRIDANENEGNCLGECWEFKHGAEWTFEPDWYGAACTIHVIIFGTAIDSNIVENFLEGVSKPELSIDSPFPDTWNNELWARLFSILLNLSHASAGSNPLDSLLTELKKCLEKFEHDEILSSLQQNFS